MSSVPYRKISPFIFYTPKYIEMICDPDYIKADSSEADYLKCNTIWTLAKRTLSAVPNNPFLGTRQYDKEKGAYTEYKFITYAETIKLVEQFGSGLIELGLKRGDVCTQYLKNCTEWVIHYLALSRQGAIASPFRHGFTTEYYKNIVNLTEPSLATVSVLFMDEFLDVCESIVKGGKPLNYKFVVVMPQPMGPLYGTESIQTAQYERAKSIGLRLVKWEEVIELGKAHPHPESEADPFAYSAIVFTSGTTSDQLKGVPVLERGLVVFQTRMMRLRGLRFYDYSHMSHASERSIIVLVIGTQSSVGFASGTPLTFLEDTEVLKPDIFGLAPVFFKTFQSKALELIHSGVPEETVKAIFRKKFGGKTIKCVSFGAPCPEELCQWAIDFLGMEFSSIYALTEAGSGVLATPYAKNVVPFGCIGKPCPFVTARLIDAPECGCSIHSNPPRGELLIRCSGMMPGYHKNPEKTAAALDDEGFLHTSDIVQLEDDGTLTLVDRRDNMMKLASAAYIPPEKIESFLGSSHLVAQSGVWARPQDDFAVSVIVPNLTVLATDPRLPAELKERVLAGAKDPASKEAAEVCANEEVVKIYMETLTEIGKKSNFPDHWYIKGIILDPVRWTEAAGLLTFTQKLKRRGLVAKYSEKIDELVSKL